MKNKFLNRALLLAVISLFLFACEEGPNYKDYSSYYPEPIPSGISPSIGYPGTNISIDGKDFGDLAGAVKVFFGGIQAMTIVSVDDKQIVVQVPADAVSGKVSLQIWTHTLDSIGAYTVIPAPRILSVDPLQCMSGDVITISGDNFGSDANNIHVFIGDSETPINSITDSEIKITVPDISSGLLTLRIEGLDVIGPFILIGSKLIKSDKLIGHSSSWGNNPATYISAAVDGDITTFVDGPSATGFVGYDFGKGKGANISSVRYAPRKTHPARMVNGEIRGANDPTFYDAVTLHKITQQPPVDVYTEVAINSNEPYRYVYYYSADGNCNIAEIEFYGNLIDLEITRGKFIYEFDDPTETDYWVGLQDATNVIEEGKLKVTFNASQFGGTSKRRADLNFVSAATFPATAPNGKWQYSIEYPILAFEIAFIGTGAPTPGTGNIKLDRFDGAKNNVYLTDFISKNVIYYDCSIAFAENQDLASFCLKIADVASTEETGYEVDWIRSFKSKDELEEFLSLQK